MRSRRTGTDVQAIHGITPGHAPVPPTDEPQCTDHRLHEEWLFRDPQSMNDRDLYSRLCALGPGKCRTCDSQCRFGAEAVKRSLAWRESRGTIQYRKRKERRMQQREQKEKAADPAV